MNDDTTDAYDEFEKILKEKYSVGEIETVKEMLKREPKSAAGKPFLDFIPIVHNKGKIYLQMCGWSINLYDDGTWCWECTLGG